MENDETKTSDSQQANSYKWLKIIINYVQENVGAFTFLTASVVAVGSVTIRCIMYLFEYGKTIHYSVSPSLIDVSSDNVLYDCFVKGIAVLILILLNLIPYSILKSNKNVLIKICLSVLIVASPNILIILALLSDVSNGINYSIPNIFFSILFGMLFGMVLFFLGLFNGICECISISKQKKQKNQKNEDENEEKNETETKTKIIDQKLSKSKIIRKFVIQMVVVFAVEAILFFIAGWSNAASQNKFKIINSDDIYYAVIYENPSKYVITECEIEGDYVSFPHPDTQQEIDRDEVKYQWQTLTQRR